MKKRFIGQIAMSHISSFSVDKEFFDIVIYSYSERVTNLIYIIRPITRNPISFCLLLTNNQDRDKMFLPYSIFLSEII